MKLVDSEAMSAVDRRSQAEFGMPSILLMENAGQKAVDALLRESPVSGLRERRAERRGIVFVAGKGNNGGDALVMARRCRCDAIGEVSVVLAAGRPEADTDPGRNLRICESLGIPVVDFQTAGTEARTLVSSAACVVDGMAGTGLRGRLREPLSALAEAVNGSAAYTAAVDVPSGIGDGFRPGFPAVRADITLTMGLPKRCLYLPHARGLCGRITVVPVGFPPALLTEEGIPGGLLEDGVFRRLMPRIAADAHKNRRGHVAVFAGSPGTTGAAWLSANAAARARVGLVTAFLDTETYPILASRFSSVMARPWNGPGDRGLGFEAKKFDAFLIGPGWGTGGGRLRWMESLLAAGVPGVVDADGLSLLGTLSQTKGFGLSGGWVLTPHMGEFARLAEEPKDEIESDPVLHATALAQRLGAVVVLKGACTYVADPSGRYWIHDGMNPAMATAGSGDVLAGIIAAGIAQGLGAMDAALFGVSLHAAAGRRARGWFLAEDMLPALSEVLCGEE